MDDRREAELALAETLVISRTYEAPPQLVYEAWTRPEHLLAWFCPHGFAVEHAEADVRVGGAWRSRIRAPDGRRFTEFGTYREIVEPVRLVFTHAWETPTGETPKNTVVTVTFEPTATGGTEMTFRQIGLPSLQLAQQHGQGWRQAFETLHELLQA